ncbi:MAG: sugar phosphate isomerase/epimerase [Planctomycetales bacterium]
MLLPRENRRGESITRRDALGQGVAAATALASGRLAHAVEPAVGDKAKKGCTLGFSTYGMKTLKVEEAVNTVAEIGYDAIEIAARPDWDSAPNRMSATRRATVRRSLEASGLKLVSLMEHLIPSANEKEHAAQLNRLAGVFELAGDLSAGEKPLMQTVLGGGKWDEKRDFFRDRLGDWLELARKHEIVIAVKPHRGGGMSRPSEALWLMKQLGRPRWLRMVYDYSHYAYRDLPLDQTIAAAAPYAAHVAVKDAVRQNGRVVFKLPGETGEIDFARIIKKFHDAGYQGDFNCEVSSMVSSKPGYDPRAAAKTCYANMSQAFRKSGVKRASKV